MPSGSRSTRAYMGTSGACSVSLRRNFRETRSGYPLACMCVSYSYRRQMAATYCQYHAGSDKYFPLRRSEYRTKGCLLCVRSRPSKTNDTLPLFQQRRPTSKSPTPRGRGYTYSAQVCRPSPVCPQCDSHRHGRS